MIGQRQSFRPDRPTLLLFGLLVLANGGASVAIRFTYAELEPFWGAAVRFWLGAIVFWAITVRRQIPLPKDRALIGTALYGTLTFGGAAILLYWGLTKTPASLYQILIALVPLLTIFLAGFHRLEQVRPRGILGAVFAAIGIAIAVGGTESHMISFPHIASIVGAAACFAEAGVVAKSFPETDPFTTNAIGMTIGAGLLTGVSILQGEPWILPRLVTTWISFGYIVVFVTILAYFLYLHVLRRWTASGAAYSFVLVPLVTVVLASTLVGERITLRFIAGSLLVLAGVFMGALLPQNESD